MKFAVVSHVLPPSWSGQAMVLYRLLKDLDPGRYCLISRQSYNGYSSEDGLSAKLPAAYHHLPPEFEIRRGSRLGLRQVRSSLNLLLLTLQRAGRIAGIVRRAHCSAVVACTGDLLDPPAGYVASRLARVPFYPYVFDYYSYQWTRPGQRFFAQCFERFLLKGAHGVIVPNEFLRDAYRCRYGVESSVIHNPCDVSAYEAVPDGDPRPGSSEIRVVYTGAVYAAQYDAFQRMVLAIEQLGCPDLRLHLYTAQSPDELAREQIRGPIVYHKHRALSDMPRVQRQADILFLPLAFASPYPEVIRTSAPGKMGEYLASGRPILAHTPTDSFVSWYFKHYQCGVVVDQSEATLLAQAIQQLVDGASLRRRLGENARARARADFSLAASRAAFFSLLQLAEEG